MTRKCDFAHVASPRSADGELGTLSHYLDELE